MKLNGKEMVLQITKSMILPEDCGGSAWAKSVGVWQMIVAERLLFSASCAAKNGNETAKRNSQE